MYNVKKAVLIASATAFGVTVHANDLGIQAGTFTHDNIVSSTPAKKRPDNFLAKKYVEMCYNNRGRFNSNGLRSYMTMRDQFVRTNTPVEEKETPANQQFLVNVFKMMNARGRGKIKPEQDVVFNMHDGNIVREQRLPNNRYVKI